MSPQHAKVIQVTLVAMVTIVSLQGGPSIFVNTNNGYIGNFL